MSTIKDDIARYFKNREGIVAVYLFGSHAQNASRPFSDVDIGIIAEYASVDDIKKQFNNYIVELGRLLRKDVHPVMLNLATESLLSQVFLKGQCLAVNHRRALSEFRMHRLVRIVEFNLYKQEMRKGFIEKFMEA